MKKIIKNNLLGFILGAVIFSGITVLATQYLASDISFTPKDTKWKKSNGEDITNVKDAIDELYINANKDNYDDKIYTQEGLNVFNDRVTILSGGYYVDESNITWVNLRMRLNVNLTGDTAWLLIYGLPKNINEVFYVTGNDKKYAFRIGQNDDGRWSNCITYRGDYLNNNLPIGTEFTLQFKY